MDVVALVRTDEARARLREATPNGAAWHVCTRVDELPRLVRQCAADAVIVEPRDALNVRAARVVCAIRRRFPHVAIAVYCSLDPESARDLVPLIKAGADEVILRGYDDPAVWLARRQKAAQWRTAALTLLEQLSPHLEADVRSLMTYCFEVAPGVPTVTGAANALGVHRKTLVNRLGAAGLPNPRVLVSWSRLLVALELLSHSGRSVESVAHAMGFGSGAALRKMCRRYTGLRTKELRELGGRTHAIALFLAQLVTPSKRRTFSKRARSA